MSPLPYSSILRALLFLLLSSALSAADPATQLLSASAAGKTSEVETLLGKGAPLEAHDKDGRTPLMLAAQHGHVETVRLLLTKGADAAARDKTGLTAYGLALLEPAGHADHDPVLQALPQPRQLHIGMEAIVAAGALISSCFLPPGALKQEVTNLDLASTTVKDIVEYARISGRGIAEIVQEENPADTDAHVTIEIQPGAACDVQVGDSLNLTLEVRIYRGSERHLQRKKEFASGFKGLRKQTVANAEQYGPVYRAWIKPQAGPIYWFIVQTLL